jgi:hypothetical protein
MKSIITFTWAAVMAVSVIAQPSPVKLPWDPRAIAVDSKDNLYIEFEKMLLKISPDGQATYVSENIAKGFRGAVSPDAEIMVTDAAENVYMTKNGMSSIWKLTPDGKFAIHAAADGYTNAWAEPAKKPVTLEQMEFLSIDKAGNFLFSSRYEHSSTSIFYRLTTDNETEVLKNSQGDTVKIGQVTGIAADSAGNLYVANVKERCIKKIDRNGMVTVVAGQCGKRDFCPVYTPGDVRTAELVQPGDMVFNKKGELLFADERMNRIIKVADGKVTTVAGSSLIQPCGSNIGGRSKEGYKDGPALSALFNFPEKVRLAIDSKDNIYILDLGNNAVRKLSPNGIVSTVAINLN